MDEGDFDQVQGVAGVLEAEPYIQGLTVTILDHKGKPIGGVDRRSSVPAWSRRKATPEGSLSGRARIQSVGIRS